MVGSREQSSLNPPYGRLHTSAVVSSLPEMRCLPSGVNVSASTRPRWPRYSLISVPVCTSHRWIGPSQVPDASRLPSGENARLTAVLSRPVIALTIFPVSDSQITIRDLPCTPSATYLRSGEKASPIARSSYSPAAGALVMAPTANGLQVCRTAPVATSQMYNGLSIDEA